MRTLNIVQSKTSSTAHQKSSHQKPMGFSEFNHCIDILLPGLPGITRTQQANHLEAARSNLWETDTSFANHQAA